MGAFDRNRDRYCPDADDADDNREHREEEMIATCRILLFVSLLFLSGCATKESCLIPIYDHDRNGYGTGRLLYYIRVPILPIKNGGR